MFERSHADGIIVIGDIEGGDATMVAAEVLVEMVAQGRHRSAVQDVVLTPTLVVRQSTAPPAGSA